MRVRFPHAVWNCAWPHECVELINALAVAAAFPELVGPLEINLTGDANEAFEVVRAGLTEAGIEPPEIRLRPVPVLPEELWIGRLPTDLVTACEHERRRWIPVFFDPAGANVDLWQAAAAVLAEDERATVTVVVDGLDGCDAVDFERTTVVSGNGALRQEAHRRGIAAVPRPPSARHLPSSSALILDARRPDDLKWVGEASAHVVLTHTERLNDAALAAIASVSGVPA